MGQVRSAYKILVLNLNRRDHLDHPNVGGTKTLNWILQKQDVR